MRKLSWEQVTVIRNKYDAGETQTSLAKEFGVTQASISQIILRNQHKFSPEERRQKRLLRRRARQYNISEEEIIALGNNCHICNIEGTGRWGTMHIDHDHVTGKVRGILCIKCNQGIGSFLDSPALMEKAIEYLRRRE